MLPNQPAASLENSSGECDSASVPPVSTRSARPWAIARNPLSIDCSPEAQLRCTVQPGTSMPSPSRKPATRPGLTSSGCTLTQPSITSSKCRRSKGWRSSSGRPASTARSTGVNGPGLFCALMKGVRAPSTMKTGRPVLLLRPLHRSGCRRSCHCAALRQQLLGREIIDARHLPDQRQRFPHALRFIGRRACPSPPPPPPFSTLARRISWRRGSSSHIKRKAWSSLPSSLSRGAKCRW